MIDVFKDFISTTLVLGLIFFIVNGIIKTSNIRMRALVFLLFGISLFLIFLISLIIDYEGGNLLKYYSKHLLYIFSSLLIALFVSIPMFITANKNYIRLRNPIKSKVNYHEKEYLYIIYKYNDHIILEDKNGKYSGIISLMKNSYFHDESLKKYNNKLGINDYTANMLGTVNVKGKKNNLYYCYLVNINNNISNSKFKEINQYQLLSLNIDDFNKQVLLRMMIGEKFELEM